MLEGAYPQMNSKRTVSRFMQPMPILTCTVKH